MGYARIYPPEYTPSVYHVKSNTLLLYIIIKYNYIARRV